MASTSAKPELAVGQVSKVLQLTKNDVERLFTDLGLTSHREDFLLNVTEVEWNYVPKIREAVKYLGFDAKKIIARFLEIANDPVNKRADDDSPSLAVGDMKLFDKCDAKTDLIFLLTLFLERGNNMSKALLRCDPTTGDVIKRKCGAYGIQLEKRQNITILGSSQITLARLAQAFSPATAAMIISHNIDGKLKSKLFKSPLPLLMQHTVFSGLIPQQMDEYEDLRKIAIYLNIETTILLSSPKDKRKMMNQSLDDLMENAQQYVDAAITGSCITEEIRIKTLIAAGILVRDDNKIVGSPSFKALAGEIPGIMSRQGMAYSRIFTVGN